MPKIEVKLFGTVRMRSVCSDKDLDISRSLQLLLSFLMIHREVAHPRERLVDALWRDVAPGLGRSRLSTAVWRLRRQIRDGCGCDILASNGSGDLRLDRIEDLWLDVADFEDAAMRFLRLPIAGSEEQALTAAHRAIGLFSQELMEGHYCDWVLTERKRLNDLKERCLAKLVIDYAARDRHEEALTTALDLIALDPLREDAHRAVMQAQFHLGRPHLARRQYEECRELLSRELDLVPAPETHQLNARLLAAEADERRLDASQRSDLLALQTAVMAAEDILRDISRRIDSLLCD